MDPALVSLDAFEAMVVDALDPLPAWVRATPTRVVEVCDRLEEASTRVVTTVGW